MNKTVCRHCGGPINSVPYEDQFCSEECYIEKYQYEDAEDVKMNGVAVLSNPWAWS